MKKVQILDWEDKLTGSIGELVHETSKQFCVLLEGGIYIPYCKLRYSYQEYKSPEDIQAEKLEDILDDYFEGEYFKVETMNRIIKLFKEV